MSRDDWIAGRHWMAFDENAVNHSCDSSADHRAEPINVAGFSVVRRERGTERSLFMRRCTQIESEMTIHRSSPL